MIMSLAKGTNSESSAALKSHDLVAAGLQQRLTPLEKLAKWYLSLSPTHPPAYYLQPVPLVRAREEYDDEKAGGFLKWFGHGGIRLRNAHLLDLGSGYGGRTVRYKELGAARAVGLEISKSMVNEGIEFARVKNLDVEFYEGVGENLPFENDSFDVILSYDVFEHIETMDDLLRECRRVLKPGGTLYAVFPPFYHPTGSHLDGFVSKMPYANVLFPSKPLMNAATAILIELNDPYRPTPLRKTDKLWALNGVTIASFRRFVRETAFSSASLSLAPLFSPMNSKWESWRMKFYAPFFRPLRHIPLVQELFVHRIVCKLTK